MILRKSFYIRWSAGRSPRVHEVNPGRDPSNSPCRRFSLRGIAHPVVGKIFSGTGGTPREGTS